MQVCEIPILIDHTQQKVELAKVVFIWCEKGLNRIPLFNMVGELLLRGRGPLYGQIVDCNCIAFCSRDQTAVPMIKHVECLLPFFFL